MDSRGIPIVYPAVASPKRPNQRYLKHSYFVKQEQPVSTFEVWDAYNDVSYSHFNHSTLNDDYKHNVQPFQKTELFASDILPSAFCPTTPKRFKSSLHASDLSSASNEFKVPELSRFSLSQQDDIEDEFALDQYGSQPMTDSQTSLGTAFHHVTIEEPIIEEPIIPQPKLEEIGQKRSREEEEDSLPSLPDIITQPIEETVDPIAVTVKLNTQPDFPVEPSTCVSAPAAVIKTVNKRSSKTPSVVAPKRMTRSAVKVSNQPVAPPCVPTPRRTRQKKVQLQKPPIEKVLPVEQPSEPPVVKPVETIQQLTIKLPKAKSIKEEVEKDVEQKVKQKVEQTVEQLQVHMDLDRHDSKPEQESMDLLALDANSLDKEMEKRMEGVNTEQEKAKLREQYKQIKEQQEIRDINRDFPTLKERYALVERAGRGTFSKVYKAKDLMVDAFEPIDEKYAENNGESHVAIKVIFEISSPQRVRDEINYLAMFRNSPCITPLIEAFRHEANTYVVLPYIEYDHFDAFYKKMSLEDIKCYISQLLTGLAGVHKESIIHRDVKPGNFLYNKTTKSGYLADFGLAQEMKFAKPGRGGTVNTNYTQHDSQGGYYTHEIRPSIQANRSGTKGFRAPEIMLRFANQTTAIDIWAVGVILLIILSGQYPFFNPDDDADGICELAHFFGMKQLTDFLHHYNRKLLTNIPDIPNEACDFAQLCRTINKERVETWDPIEYNLAIDLMKQCLQLIHTNRCTATSALDHPFFSKA